MAWRLTRGASAATLADILDTHERAQKLGARVRSSSSPPAGSKGEKKEKLAWSKAYTLMLALDQTIVDKGKWLRSFPFLHLHDPPSSALRKPGKSLMPTPVSRLLDPRAAAVLVRAGRLARRLAGPDGRQAAAS